MQFIGRGPARPVSHGLLDGVTLSGPQASIWLGVQTLSLCLTSALLRCRCARQGPSRALGLRLNAIQCLRIINARLLCLGEGGAAAMAVGEGQNGAAVDSYLHAPDAFH
jgi:hypothetical protein